jgi:hypothetical protein
MLVEIESVLMVVIAYVVGLVSVIFFARHRTLSAEVTDEYERRMREYEDMLVEMRIQLDILELRANDVSHVSHQVSQKSGDASDGGHKPRAIRRNLEQEGKGLVDFVIKLLSDGPKTSRQIETVIGRSREHTARLMKKLFELGYVTRDTSSKPYTYAITDAGKAVLSQVTNVSGA